MTELTQKYVRLLFDYLDSNLYWKVSVRGRKIGVIAGGAAGYGYRQITINGKKYFEHRLIFLYHHGYLPEFLDHIDGNRSNNNIGNLRESTHQENCRNQKKSKVINGKLTTSEYKGVSLEKMPKNGGFKFGLTGKENISDISYQK